MDKLTRTLLGGAASAVLAASPAIAGKPQFGFHVTALHGGRTVNKTNMHNQPTGHITYTLSISTSVAASDRHKTVNLTQTFYKWNSISDAFATACGGNPRQKIKAPKKSLYAKVAGITQTYSRGCTEPSVFYGDAYTLKDKSGFGQTDRFRSTLYGWYKNPNGKYKGTLNLDVSVAIGTK